MNNITNLVANNNRISRNFKNKKKTASLYIKNKVIISERKTLAYPNLKVAGDLRLSVKNVPTKLTQNLFHLVKQKNKSTYGQRTQRVIIPGSVLNLKRKRKYNFYQKNFKNLMNIKNFYSLDNKTLTKYKSLKNFWPDTYHGLFLRNVEGRLDVVLVRLGYANHIQHARQLIKKGVIFVDNKKVINKHHLITAGSIVETRSSTSPFLMVYRQHLEYYPKSWNKFKRRKHKSWIKKLKKTENVNYTESPFCTNLNKKIKLRLRRKLKWKKGAWKKIIKRKPSRYPIATLPQQFTKIGINKTLVTHFCKNKDITIPYSMSNTRPKRA